MTLEELVTPYRVPLIGIAVGADRLAFAIRIGTACVSISITIRIAIPSVVTIEAVSNSAAMEINATVAGAHIAISSARIAAEALFFLDERLGAVVQRLLHRRVFLKIPAQLRMALEEIVILRERGIAAKLLANLAVCVEEPRKLS